MLRFALTFSFVLCLCCYSSQAQNEPIWTADGLVYPNGANIPAGLTDIEREYLKIHPIQVERGSRVPPSGTIYCVPEYDPMEGLLISWNGYTSVLTDLASGITSGDPTSKVFVVVDSSSEQSSAYSTLFNAGTDMNRVEFIIRTTDTVWIRDYGPRYIYEDGVRAIIDHTYNRPRPNDNAFNNYLSQLWDQPQYDIPLTHGGGNFHLFGTGDAFMSSLILAENSGLSEQDVIDLYAEYQNVDLTIYTGFPTTFDSTRHIDMWMLPVADDEIIIGQYSPSDGQPYTITEDAVDDLESRGYTVYRTPGWNSGGTHYTYTNAVILNSQVFVPTFSSSNDAVALSVFQTAFPDKNCVQIYCGDIIHAAGAIHCIVMHVPAPAVGMMVTPGDDLAAAGPAGGPFSPDSIVYTLENFSSAAIEYSVTNSADWLTVTNAAGTIPATSSIEITVTINEQANDLGHGLHEDTLYFTNLADHEGDTQRAVSIEVDAMGLQYSFPLETDPGWSVEGDWAFGQPTGEGSHYGDPETGYTGNNVYGYNLSGDYSNNMPEYNLTTTALDCSNMAETELRFQRWLGVERGIFDHAAISVSNDGSTWTQVWTNPNTTISESAWGQVSYDISEIADDQTTVYIRWTMGTSDNSTSYPGWNIDDVEIWAVSLAPNCPGDLDGDLDVDLADLSAMLANYGTTSGAEYEDGDMDGDGDVDLSDLSALLAVYGTTC